MDEEFFKKYRKEQVQPEGIPGHRMNAPLSSNTLKGQLGLELEVEAKTRTPLPAAGNLDGVKGDKTKVFWTTHQDGSLRGNALEYVLSEPALPEEIPGLINGLYSVMEVMGTKLNNSNRCSTHVHKNISGCTVNILTSMFVLFCTFEDLFVPWCGEERSNNHFCLSSRETPSVVNAWHRYLSSGDRGLFRGRDLKYSAFNLCPVWERGSVEVRCGPKPDSAEQVIDWVDFVNRLLEHAKTYVNPQAIGHDLSERGGYGIFQNIGGKVVQDILKEKSRFEIDDISMGGFRRVQHLVFAHPWDRWLELIQKQYVPDPFDAKGGKTRIRRPLDGEGREERPLDFERDELDEEGPVGPPMPNLDAIGRAARLQDAVEFHRRAMREVDQNPVARDLWAIPRPQARGV